MSQLYLTAAGQQFVLNVLSFSSPIFATMNGAQTKTQYQYFPIKANQPQMEFDVLFASEMDYENFQIFVRNSQVHVLTATGPAASNLTLSGSQLVALYWPQRNIENYTGVITAFEAGGKRRNYTPRAKFTVDLADSMVSHVTQIASLGAVFSIVKGIGSSDVSSADNALSAPTGYLGKVVSLLGPKQAQR